MLLLVACLGFLAVDFDLVCAWEATWLRGALEFFARIVLTR